MCSGGVADVAFLEQVFDHLRLFLAPEEMATDGAHHLQPRARPTLPEGVGFHVLILQFVRVQFGAMPGRWMSRKSLAFAATKA